MWGRKPITEVGWYWVRYPDGETMVEEARLSDTGVVFIDIGESGWYPPCAPNPGTMWTGPIPEPGAA